MTDKEFIIQNRNKDVRSLALKKAPEGVRLFWCLQQIEGWQLAQKKLPRWAETDDLWFPPRLSMEQCSSESTATYKRDIIQRLHANSLADLTGGFGVDFTYMAQGLPRATYVERQEVLCESARHNFPILGLPDAEIVNGDAEETLRRLDHVDAIFIDPARRDDVGRKTVAIEDCTPDVSALQDLLLQKATYVIIKLSPMLDITQALRSLRHVAEVHVVSHKGECKELLLVLHKEADSVPDNAVISDAIASTYYCVNLNTQDAPFIVSPSTTVSVISPSPTTAPVPLFPASTSMDGLYLFEPNASILKAGQQDTFGTHYMLQKLHPQSNLFVGPQPIQNVPARQFRIVSTGDFSKSSLKHLLSGVKQANITVRNFPATVADLRKRLKIKDGGKDYLFATTLQDGSHIIIKGEKATLA